MKLFFREINRPSSGNEVGITTSSQPQLVEKFTDVPSVVNGALDLRNINKECLKSEEPSKALNFFKSALVLFNSINLN